MSVATKNPFALLDDDEAPSAPVAVEPTPAAAPAARGANQKSRGGPAARGGKYYARGGKPASKDSAPLTEESEGQKKFEGREAREGGRGRGDRGGRGGGRGGSRGGRGRPFDRHSQTGKTDSDKKIHQSWGGDDGNTELKAEQAATADATAETANNEWGADTGAAADWGGAAETSTDAWAAPPADAAAPAEGEAKTEGRPRREREPEEEDNTLTLDQYLAQQKEKDTAVPKLEATRKANDGADDIWKDAVAIAKNEEEEAYFVGKGKSAPKARTKKEEKVYLEIDARFERPDRGGRGRGGRGGDRGGDRGDRGRGARGRGGARGGRQNNGPTAAVNVDDQTAFPSLS